MMKMYLFSLLLLVISISGLSQENPESEIAAAAVKIIDAYHSVNPEPGNRVLHVVCWRPRDREFAKGYRERLSRIMKHIQNFYADEMSRHGLGFRTIQLDFDDQGDLVIHEALGEGNFADYEKPDGERVKQECWPVLRDIGLNPARETILIFTNLSDWDPEKKTFVHKSPYYARGNHQLGVAWQLDSPELDTINLPLKEPMIIDGEYGRISLGKHNSIFIGGIAHELGHALGLPHCRARKDQAEKLGTALMGSGNRTYFEELRDEGKGSFITLAHALRLAAHPQFSNSVKGINLPVSAKFEELSIADEDKQFSISGRVDSPVPVYAVVAYLDPEGGGDYDSLTHVTVPDAGGNFSINCSAIVPGKSAQVRLFGLLVNGATARWRGAYEVDKTGVIDVTMLQSKLKLEPLVQAITDRDMNRVTKLINRFDDDSVYHRIATSVLGASIGKTEFKSLREIPEEATSYPLSRVTPTEVSVGWLKPAYDRLPRRDALLISGTEIFETGIYAHPPALHRYELSGSRWKTLKGKCGLADNRSGSVVFVIKTDGKEVFRSSVMKPGTPLPFRINLRGKKSLELMTEDAGDGASQDWGLWLGVELIES